MLQTIIAMKHFSTFTIEPLGKVVFELDVHVEQHVKLKSNHSLIFAIFLRLQVSLYEAMFRFKWIQIFADSAILLFKK